MFILGWYEDNEEFSTSKINKTFKEYGDNVHFGWRDFIKEGGYDFDEYKRSFIGGDYSKVTDDDILHNYIDDCVEYINNIYKLENGNLIKVDSDYINNGFDDKIIKDIENLGWSAEIDKSGHVTLKNNSPSGEQLVICAMWNRILDHILEVYDDYDEESYAQGRLKIKMSENGVMPNLHEIVKDSDAIADMLADLARVADINRSRYGLIK